MLYPRKGADGKLVEEGQLVSYQEHLLNKRILFLTGELIGGVSEHNILMAVDSISPAPIRLVVSSPGGSVDSAFLLYDTMRLCSAPIHTLGRYAASAASWILAAGERGHRYVLPHAKVLLHLPSAQLAGDSKDLLCGAREVQKYQERIVDILLECGAKRTREQILADMDRDFWLDAKETIEYGLADKIMDKETMKEWLA